MEGGGKANETKSLVVSVSAVKDIVHQASNQLAEVGIIWDPHVVLPGIHGKFQVGFTEAPARCAVVLTTRYTREGCDVNSGLKGWKKGERKKKNTCMGSKPTLSEDMMVCTSFRFRLALSLRCRS